MALPSIRKIPPISVYSLRGINENEVLHIPELVENRQITDSGCLILFAGALLILITISAYTAVDTDYSRFLNGHDKCGDTCGSENKPISKINCSGKNLKNKPFMKYRFTGKKNGSRVIVKNQLLPEECVDQCESPNRLLFRRCIPPNDMLLDKRANDIMSFIEFIDDLNKTGVKRILPIVGTGLVLSAILLLCFHLIPTFTVWTILIMSFISLTIFTGYIWYWYLDNTTHREFFYIGIVTSITIFFLAIFICYFHDKYSIVIEMFSEATAATFKLPGLMLVPVVAATTFETEYESIYTMETHTILFLRLLHIFFQRSRSLYFCNVHTSYKNIKSYMAASANQTVVFGLTVVSVGMIFLAALLSTNASLKKVPNYPSVYEYVQTQVSEISIMYTAFVAIWLLSFANGCQCLIVAGPISACYFRRDRSTKHFPVLKSCYILFRYHLGTVALGSLCITIVTVARIILKFLEDHVTCKYGLRCVRYCLVCFEAAVEYLTKRAYIQTAMHGTPLYKSGMRAARLLWANSMDTISIDVAGDFVMICAMIFIIVLSTAVGMIHQGAHLRIIHLWAVFVIEVSIVGVVVYFFTQIINVAVETIFICFCEDKLMNDGEVRPYFMSEKLKTIVDRAKHR